VVGLSSAEARERLARVGRNEVPEAKRHLVLELLKKFWGPSAWMVELVALVPVPLRHFADLALALGQLVVNAALAFLPERRASGAVAALRSRLQVNARVRRQGRHAAENSRLICATRTAPAWNKGNHRINDPRAVSTST